jgi:hypothetical protein
LGQLGLGLGEGRLALNGFEAGGIPQRLTARNGLGLLLQQGDLRFPLGDGGALLQPGKPAFQQVACRLMLGILQPLFGLMDAQAAELAIEGGLARQPHLALQVAIPFLKAIIGAAGGVDTALLSPEEQGPLVVARFQPGTVGLLDGDLAVHRPHPGVGAQDLGHDPGGWQIGGRLRGQGLQAQGGAQEGKGQSLHSRPCSSTGTSQ